MTEGDPRELPTVELVRRTHGGDRDACEALFARYRERVLAMARVRLSARLRARLESTDILQEALLEALRGLDRFEMRDESSLVRWLAVLVERRITARARYESAGKRDGGEAALAPASSPGLFAVPSADPGPSTELGGRESSERLQAALAGLPERTRELVLLRDYAGSSWETVAAELGFTSPDAARMAHARALATLGARLRLADEGP